MPGPISYDTRWIDESQNRLEPLPTPNDIDGSEKVLSDSYGRRLVRIQGKFVIRFGTFVRPIEAQNMLFVAKSTTIPIPRVYAVYQVREANAVSTYIVMQYLEGNTLEKLWKRTGAVRKESIAMTLRTYFDQLRQLQHPGYFGDIEGGPPTDPMFDSISERGCETEDEFIKAILQTYQMETSISLAPRTRYYKQVLPTVLRGSGVPTFSHGDFQRENIMVQPDGTIYMIEWKYASWYPDYWEYACATSESLGGLWRDDWHDYVRKALDVFPNQAAWLSNMRKELWCY